MLENGISTAVLCEAVYISIYYSISASTSFTRFLSQPDQGKWGLQDFTSNRNAKYWFDVIGFRSSILECSTLPKGYNKTPSSMAPHCYREEYNHREFWLGEKNHLSIADGFQSKRLTIRPRSTLQPLSLLLRYKCQVSLYSLFCHYTCHNHSWVIRRQSTIRRQMTLTAASHGARKVLTYSYRPRHCEIIQAEARGSAVTIA